MRCEKRGCVIEREMLLCGDCFCGLSMTKLRVTKRGSKWRTGPPAATPAAGRHRGTMPP